MQADLGQHQAYIYRVEVYGRPRVCKLSLAVYIQQQINHATLHSSLHCHGESIKECLKLHRTVWIVKELM